MSSEIKNCCPNCNQSYKVHAFTPKHKGNIPLLLACGHSMCEKCVKNIIQFIEPIECKICHRDMEIKQSDRALLGKNKITLYQLFPVNVFMLGELTLQQMEEFEKMETDADESYYIDLQAIIQSTDNTKGECKECLKPTTKMCQQCSAIVCEACFTKSHKNFVLFKSHNLTNIVPAIEPNFCKLHKEKSLDYYCKDCSKSVCMDCMMVGGDKSCKYHNVVSMDEVNEIFAKDIVEVSPKLDDIFKRLTKTAVDVGNLLHNIENDTGSTCELSNMILNVEQHFSKLSSQIQKHKQEVIHIILQLKSSEKESLRKAKNDIENSIKLTKKVLNSINLMSSSNQQKQLNLATLLENAKQIIETPWYLSRDENKADPLKVTVNEDLCALITDYIQLEGNVKSVYRLYSTSELGADFELPPPPMAPVFPPQLPKDVRQQNRPKVEKKDLSTTGFFKSVPKYRNKSGSASSLNSLESDSSYKSSFTQKGNTQNQKPIVHPVPPFEESHQPKQLYEGSQELIYITHIIDPHNFYVQRACHQRMVKEMIREFRNATSLPKPSLSHVSEGKVYLMFNKADNMWQRCRIVSIDRKNIDKPLFHVFCIDFGSTEVITIDKLRLLPPARLQSPYPLAINCSLANCEPKTGSWTSDDSILIQNIIDNKQAVIYIRHIRSAGNYSVKFECDVTTFEDGVSIAHALVFHERAKMPNPKLPYPKILGIAEKPKLFMNHNDFKLKSVEEVYITHIVSPDKFFVRKRHLQQIYENLCEDLEQEYNLSDNSGCVHLPEIGMVCAVNLEKCGGESGHGSWARGIVIELPGRGRVRLLLPDTGALLLAHWAALRHIRPRLTTLRALATECYLAGVTPLKKKWSPASVALLHKFEDRLLELHVEDCRNRSTLGVSLYDRADPDDEICINNEMIKHKFAITFGLFVFNKGHVEEQFVTKNTPIEVNAGVKPPAKKVEIIKKHEPLKQEVVDDDLDAKDKGPLRLEVKILHYLSPSLLYVSLIHQQKTFNELFEKIQKFYSTKKMHCRKNWSVGDKCCTFCTESQTWRRAVLIEMENENAKVFYSDFACIETVSVANLRELSSEFTSIGDAAIKCHLCGVIPAVGGEWPSVTKEYLKELLDVYKRTFITKLGNFKNKSMPIEIWVYHTVQGGALEPNKSEWRCLNNKIIEQGLGIPDKSMEDVAVAPALDDDDEMLSFLNITGSVREWLQLEPLPTKPLNQLDLVGEGSIPEDVEGSDVKMNTIDFISDWLSPEPITNKEFTAIPTYIDNDGVIFLHDVTHQDTLDMIRRALEHRFKNPDPKAKYTKWSVGEPCIAMFFLDNQFYRGRVLEVNNDTSSCLIHYIDYGNEEMCDFINLRKSIALHQIPTQAHKCILDRIRPVGASWDRQVLDYIHKMIVEKQCFVRITNNAQKVSNNVIPIDLKCNNLSINDHLVDFEMAVYLDGSKAVIRKFAPLPAKNGEELIIESDSGPDYIVADDNEIEQLSISCESFNMEAVQGKDWNKLIEEEDDDDHSLEGNFIIYPKYTTREFLCNITIINDLNLLELSIIHDDETNLLYEEMFQKLQKEGGNMSPLNGIFENKACLALFHEDNQWYRASIMQYSETKNQVKVRYVDFGNIEIISLADAREIPDTYAELPPASILVKLYGVTVNPNLNVDSILQEYSNTFLDKGPFHAKVIDFANLIPLVELRNDNNEIVYDNLIMAGIFQKNNVE